MTKTKNSKDLAVNVVVISTEIKINNNIYLLKLLNILFTRQNLQTMNKSYVAEIPDETEYCNIKLQLIMRKWGYRRSW